MAFLKLLVCAGLFTAVIALPVDGDSGPGSQTAINYRLPDNVVPVHYNIKLIPYIDEGENNFTFDGESSIRIEIRRATRDLSLHALDLTINETVTSLAISDNVVYTPAAHNYDNITQILILNFDNELPSGIYTLNIRYVGILNNELRGFFRTSYTNEAGNKVWLAASHFEATYARRAFPCWDEPALKATFNISIKHHRHYTALSNMPIREQSDDGNENGMVWTHFNTTPVMSTYLVAFVVADYVRVPNADETVNMWCQSDLAPHTKLAQQVAERAGQILTKYTNSTDKVPKMDHVSVPSFTAGAMENWGLIIYVQSSFVYREGVDTLSRKINVAVTAAHEMAHQWFGNVVSPLWWSHVWLNEGFASFFEEYILNEIFTDWREMEFFVVKVVQNALRIDVAKNMKPITLEVNSPKEIESLFSYSSYGKAPAILRMLQHIISDEVFRKGITKYLHIHQFNSATSDDLWSALQEVLDESNVPHSDYRLKEVMDTWIKQRHFPVVHVTRNNDTGEIILTQEHFRPQNESEHVDDDKWWIPLNFATQTNPDFSNTLPSHWLRPQDQNITIDEIDPNDWIIVNLQQTGYYRVNYDLANWQKIADYLQSDNYKNIHVLNRAQIINDAYHLMVAQQLDIRIFLEIASYLRKETDYVALYPMFEILEITEEFYKLPDIEIVKEYILAILEGIVSNIEYMEDPTEDDFAKLKRVQALKWACTFGHSECKRIATIKLNQHLENPEKYKVSSDLREWIYCNGMMEANASTWYKLLDVYAKVPNGQILNYLACSEDPDILINYLNISTSNDSIIQDYYEVLYCILDRHADNDIILDYVLTNLEKISLMRNIDMEDTLSNVISFVHSNEALDKISECAKNKFDEEEFRRVQNKIEKRKSVLSDKFATLRPLIIEERK